MEKWNGSGCQGKKQPEADPSVTEAVKMLRQEAKDVFGWLKNNYFDVPLEVMLERERQILPGLQMLVELTAEFSKRFQAEKRSRNLIDFNDQEHFALDILLDENREPTGAAGGTVTSLKKSCAMNIRTATRFRKHFFKVFPEKGTGSPIYLW